MRSGGCALRARILASLGDDEESLSCPCMALTGHVFGVYERLLSRGRLCVPGGIVKPALDPLYSRHRPFCCCPTTLSLSTIKQHMIKPINRSPFAKSSSGRPLRCLFSWCVAKFPFMASNRPNRPIPFTGCVSFWPPIAVPSWNWAFPPLSRPVW